MPQEERQNQLTDIEGEVKRLYTAAMVLALIWFSLM